MSTEPNRPAPLSRLERRYRRLLRCYPASWRRRHADEMVAVLLDQAEATHRTTVGVGSALDLIGHGAEARLDALVRWLPVRLRQQVAMSALVAGAALGLLMLVGEAIGAHFRPSADEISHYGRYFLSGPFLTIGVGLYLALMSAALLVVLGRGGPARLLLLAAVAFTAWLRFPAWSGAYPTPKSPVLFLLGGLALLASLATIRPTRRTARGMTGYGAALVAVLAVGLLVTKPFLGWSIGTLATSGNVAFAALATALPFVVLVALVVAVRRRRTDPGWSAALAVAALPVVLFCTATSQLVNPSQAGPRAFIPLAYVLVAVAVALVARRSGRRSAVR